MKRSQDRDLFHFGFTRKRPKHEALSLTDVMVSHVGRHLSLIDRHNLSISFNKRMYDGFTQRDPSLRILRTDDVRLYDNVEVIAFLCKRNSPEVYLESAAIHGHTNVLSFLCKYMTAEQMIRNFRKIVLLLVNYDHIDLCKKVFHGSWWNQPLFDLLINRSMRMNCWRDAVLCKQHAAADFILRLHQGDIADDASLLLDRTYLFIAMTATNLPVFEYYWKRIESTEERIRCGQYLLDLTQIYPITNELKPILKYITDNIQS